MIFGNYVECNFVFLDFINVSYEDIKGFVLRFINKFCVFDFLFVVVMKECFNLLIFVLINIVNIFLFIGVMFDVLKIVVMILILKKYNVDFIKYESF